MDLEELQAHWNRFGEEDPLWAILTTPGTKYGRWDKDEFFRSGVTEIQTVLERVDRRAQLEGTPLRRHRALDFGCGVGRLSQALAGQFEECDGVDIAPSMVAEAERVNAHAARCRYHLNSRDDLSLFESDSFDFIYTAHVLQHMEPAYAKRYIAEFLRLLRPGGYALFEVVTEPVVGATEALPDDAFVAGVTLPAGVRALTAGARHLLAVRVVNLSPRTWPASGENGWFLVVVGNHWYGAKGDLVRLDDGLAHLPRDLTPNDSVEVELEITAPSTPGTYRLQVDLVQEGVAWYADRGSTCAEATVVVTAPGEATPRLGRVLGRLRPRRASPPATPARAETPASGASRSGDAIMEMHGLPEDVVASVVEAAGGRVVEIMDWDELSGTPSTDWHRRGFVVTTAEPASTAEPAPTADPAPTAAPAPTAVPE